MPLRIEANAEPIPGYRLIERLGSGGFGEVWKAEAPGGLFKAIKFVQRGGSFDDSIAIHGTNPERSRAEQEWKSLLRVKTVRHPFILLLDRFENIDNYLVIVMELADRTLADRFKECRTQGRPGIPREELLSYLFEAAEVLDLMNSMYQLQHLDIKPQNLFLVHNHIKVADFGLVKDTTGGVKLMTITGGVTPVYAAPETFDGKFSRQSDQYSLAIVYQEMLTGYRPFSGTSMKQLILQHLQNAHDLSSLPVHDRPIIAQALTKNPEDRFLTCVDLVARLKQATMKIEPATDGPRHAPAPPPPPPGGAFPSVSKTVGTRGQSGPVKTAEPNFPVESEFLGAPPPPRRHPVEAASDPSSGRHSTEFQPRPKVTTTPRRSSTELPGIVQPALVIGIGQLGVETLTQLRQRLATEFGSPTPLAHVRLIAIDTDAEVLQKAIAADSRSSLRTQETFHARLQRPSHYLKTRDGKLTTDSWLNSRLLHRIPRDQNGAGVRALGRLAFVDNYRVLSKRIETELQALTSQDTPHNSDSVLDLGVRSHCPRVYVVTSLSGNTGGGMFVDLAYLVRKILIEQGHDAAEIVGLFFLPSVRRDTSSPVVLGNTYAALTELQHYTQQNAIFSAHYETAASTAKGERVANHGSAFQRCVFMSLPEPKGRGAPPLNAPVLSWAGDFLYRECATQLGQAIDEQRKTKIAATTPGPVMQGVGMSRILWPRHAVLEESSRRLCSRLVTRWMSKDAQTLAEPIRQWTAERWESLGLRPENLIERFQELVEESVQQKPETLLAEILAILHQTLAEEKSASKEANKAKPATNMVPVVQAVDCLERILGIPDEARAASKPQVEPAMIERALDEIAHVVADECEQKLAELAVTLLEDPNYRLAGAEETLRQFGATVEQALQSQEILARELGQNATQLFQRIQKLIETSVPTVAPTSTQWTLIAKKPTAAYIGMSANDIFELVRTYAKTRYHSLVLAHLNRLYVGLRGHLSDQIREVGFCRARLGELLGMIQPLPSAKKAAVSSERSLFPPGCVDLRDAVAQISQAINAEDLLAFDERVQNWIRTHCRALLEICMGSSTMVKNVAPALLQEADAFVSERLHGASVAEMYLSRKRDEYEEGVDDMIVDDLERCLEEATPEIGELADENEISIVTLPRDEYGEQLQQLLSGRLSNVKFLLTDRQDEMVFYHEVVNVRWQDLEQLGAVALDAYQQRCNVDPSSLHTREDVFEWQLIAAAHR